MPLVVETGAGVTGANTYQSLETAKERALEMGIALGTNDAAIVAALLAATPRLDTARQWNGAATGKRAFPRHGLVDSQGREYADDEVPDDIVLAQLLLAAEHLRASLLGTQTKGAIAKVKVEEVEVTYAAGAPAVPVATLAEQLMDCFAPPKGGDWNFLETRVPLPLYGWPA